MNWIDWLLRIGIVGCSVLQFIALVSTTIEDKPVYIPIYFFFMSCAWVLLSYDVFKGRMYSYERI